MASPFWTYFHDKLNWLPIFRPGPVSALMKGLALHLDDVREDILWLRRQWNPATCELELVGKYGKSRGIIRNRFDTDESYRKRVVYAYAWHKLGGKVRGLEKILSESGFNTTISNSGNKDLWAHFCITLKLGDKIYSEEESSFFWFLVNEYKPARSVVDWLRTVSTRRLFVFIGPGEVGLTRNQAYLWRWPLVFDGFCEFFGAVPDGRTRAVIAFKNSPAPEAEIKPHIALCAAGFSRSFITPGFLGKTARASLACASILYSLTRSSVCPKQN